MGHPAAGPARGRPVRGHLGHRARGRPLSAADVRTWQSAVDLGARGHYEQAWQILDRLPGSLPLSTRASHFRQIGDHAAALEWDVRALAEAVSREEFAEAWTGLGADHVGHGDVAAALAALAEVLPTGWRTATRRDWVAAEIALLQGEPDRAAASASTALRRCARHSPRHAAKSRIIRAASRGAASDIRGAVADLKVAVPVTQALRLAPLQWPAALVSADLVALDPSAAVDPRWWAMGARAVRHIAAHLPPPARAVFRGRPAVRRWD